LKRVETHVDAWNGPTHPEAAAILARHDRTLQVWEDDDLTQFVIGPPKVTAYTLDGKPFQFSHPCYGFDEAGTPIDWPMIETVDRPLEVRRRVRLA